MRNLFLVFFTTFFAITTMANIEELQTIVNDKIAFYRIYNFVHHGNYNSLNNYMFWHRPVRGWKHVINTYRSANGFTVLHRAIIHKPRPNFRIIELLLDMGADPNKTIPHNVNRNTFGQGKFYAGWTAAHMAVRVDVGREIIRLLSEYGCDFFREDLGGWTANDLIPQRTK